MLAILAGAWVGTEGGWPPAAFLALPLAGLGYCVPALGRLGRRLAARPLGSACLIGALALAVTALITLYSGVPQPAIHDESATPRRRHLRPRPPHESAPPHVGALRVLYIIQQPTYMSKYPPAQGLAMAIGQVALGYPIAGVWLSAGLACGALT